MMKTVSVLALAASASASWNDFGGYSCPDNTDNQCNTQQSSGGFGGSWGDLSIGSSVSSFGGLYFGNTECMSAGSFSKRALGGRFAPRTSDKAIGGSCGHDASSSVSIGCGSSSGSSSSSSSSSGSFGGSSSGGSSWGGSSSGGSDDEDISAFSLDSFSIYTEFSCDLEFQYTMSDGSSCKQRSSCSSEGTTVKNTQCGGATNMTIVYPTGQSGGSIPEESTTCSVNIPTMSFACGSASSTAVVSTKTTSYGGHETTTTPAVGHTVTPSSPASETKPTPTNVGGGSTSILSESTAFSFSTSYSVGFSTESSAIETPTPSAGSPTPSAASPTPSAASPTPSAASPTPSAASPTSSAESSTTSNSPVTESAPSASSSSVETTSLLTSTQVTTYIGTSTIYSTSYQTITSCAPEITNCPVSEGETATTTVVVAVSTTVCPVTETQTAVYSSGATTPIAFTSVVSSSSAPEESTSSNSPVTGGAPSGSSPSVVASATTVSSASTATETISYPTVLPACISTWTYIVGCVDNSDTSCYCPDATFVQNVYDCLYAYGESDQDVADAVQYFQGLCGSYAGDNPAVVTGATCTSYITATPTSIASVSATTIVVTATTVVPCTDSNGSTIPSSSTTVVSPISMTVPQVGLTTQVSGTTTAVGVIPVASYTTVSASTGVSPPYYTGSAAGSQPSGVAGASGAGASKTASATGAIVTAGASKAQVGAGFGAAALAAIALAL